MMFQTYVGALRDDSAIAYLRPETAQGIFANFKNVTDSTRVKIPFRHRSSRQGLPQRDHTAQFHLPLS